MNNLEYYKVFYYVAKQGSLTEAAKKLAVSQPAVSQCIRLLEQQAGTRLLVRGPRGVRLTQEGKLLFTYVENAIGQIQQGEKRLQQLLELELGEIRIGASDMTLQFYLLPYLELFHEKYPEIKVTVTNAPTPETIRYLAEEKIDFGVVSEPICQKEELQVRVVRKIQDTFVAGKRFLEYKDKSLSFRELEKLPIISLEKNTSTRSYLDGYLKENGVELHPEFELATSDMIVQFAVRNLGVGCVVKDFAKEQLKAGTLFELQFEEQIPKRSFCVITSPKTPLSVAAENLLKLLESEEKRDDQKYCI